MRLLEQFGIKRQVSGKPQLGSPREDEIQGKYHILSNLLNNSVLHWHSESSGPITRCSCTELTVLRDTNLVSTVDLFD